MVILLLDDNIETLPMLEDIKTAYSEGTELHALLSEMKKEMGDAILWSPCIKKPQHRWDPT